MLFYAFYACLCRRFHKGHGKDYIITAITVRIFQRQNGISDNPMYSGKSVCVVVIGVNEIVDVLVAVDGDVAAVDEDLDSFEWC
jgi:hypothetical protein